MTDYVTDFVQESDEQIRELNNALLTLERNPDDDEAMENIFRIAHTLKGNCGAMGLEAASDLAHAIEDLLDAVRAGDLEITTELMDVIFDAVDDLETLIDDVKQTGSVDIAADPSDTIEELRAQLEAADGPVAIEEPTDDEIEAVLEQFDPPESDDHNAYLVRLSITPDETINNGPLVVKALIDAFDLIGTDPPREQIDADEYGGSFDAVFASAVGEAAINSGLKPVDEVADFELVNVTEQFEAIAAADSETAGVAAGADEPADELTGEDAQDLEVDELLDEFTEFDNLDEKVEEIDDDGLDVFDNMGDAGSFDDLLGDQEDLDIDPEPAEPGPTADKPAAADQSEPEPATADQSEPEPAAADDDVDDASAVFDELKDEVEMVGFDELQDELDELEFDEFDSDDEVDMDELLGDDVDLDDDSFLEDEPTDEEIDDILVDEPAEPADDEFDDILADEPAEPADAEASTATSDDPIDDLFADEPAVADADAAGSADPIDDLFADDVGDEPAEVEAADSPIEAESTDSPAEAEPTDSPVEAETADSPAEAETADSPVEAEPTDSPAEAETTDSPVEAETADSPAEAETADSPAEAETADSPAEAETADSPVEAETADSPVEAETADSPTEAEAADSPTEAEAADSPIEAETADSPIEAETADSPVEAETAESPVEAESTDSPVEADSADSPVEAETTDSPVEAETAESADSLAGTEPTQTDTEVPDPVETSFEEESTFGGDSTFGDSTEDTFGADSSETSLDDGATDFDDESIGTTDTDFEDSGVSTPDSVDASADETGSDSVDDDFGGDFGDDFGDDSFSDDFGGDAFGDDTVDEFGAESFEDEPVDEFGADSLDADPIGSDDFGGDTFDDGFDTEAPSIDTGGTDDDAVGSFGDDSVTADDGVVRVVEEPTFDIPDISLPETDVEAATGDHTDEIQSVRVDVDQIDSLLTLVEGLVTSRVRLRHAIDQGESLQAISRELDGLEDLTTELQETVMDVRLVPLNTVANRLPRVVRDVARETDKQVAFEMTGETVELDRSILDRIGDPLIHLVRNAVDHGIESPERREELGKSPEGTVSVTADRSSDLVEIAVADDGGGLDADRLRSEAVEADVLTEAEAADYSDEQAYELVFHPGLSTAEEVTDVSGRGVGMDVVKRTIEDLEGTIDIESEEDGGTSITMSLPVSVAIDDILFVESGGEEFGLPTKAIEDIGTASMIETVDGQPVFPDEEGEDCPVIKLDDALETPQPGMNGSGMVVRIRDEVRPIAIHCDRVHSQQEVVVKPFEGFMRDIPGFSGATVRGRGEVVNILDVTTL